VSIVDVDDVDVDEVDDVDVDGAGVEGDIDGDTVGVDVCVVVVQSSLSSDGR
jgi:hypothetical protein